MLSSDKVGHFLECPEWNLYYKLKAGKSQIATIEKIASWEQCSILCRETPKCDSYVYHTKEFQKAPERQKICALRDSADTDRTAQENPGLVAGFTAGKCPQKGE